MSFDAAYCQMSDFYGSEEPDYEFSYHTLCLFAKNIDKELKKEVLPFCYLKEGKYFLDEDLLKENPKANKIKEYFFGYYDVARNYKSYFKYKLGIPGMENQIDLEREVTLSLWESGVDSKIKLVLEDLRAQGFNEKLLQKEVAKRLLKIVSYY